MLERTLFRLPAPADISITGAQLEMLDLVALYENQPIARAMLNFSKSPKTLRHLIRRKLIEVVAYSPARYRLTPMARIVRGNGRSRK